MSETPLKKNISKVRIYVDIFLFTLMILVLIPQSTGIPIHEWASFIILILFVLHLMINWNWIANNSTKFLKKAPNKTRFDYVLNWLLYLLMLIATVSGIVISESALPLFGIHFEPDRFWSVIHNLSATLLMAVIGIHITLHWRWIVGTFRKLKFKTDLHHLTEIKVIVSRYARQLLIIIAVSTFLSIVIWFLDYSEWAEGFRLNADPNGEDNSKNFPNSWLIYVLPLLKVTVIISIPAVLSGGIIRLKNIIVKKNIA